MSPPFQLRPSSSERKAIIRSRLWHADAQIERKSLPSAGEILAAMSENRMGGEAYDQAYPERLKQTLY